MLKTYRDPNQRMFRSRLLQFPFDLLMACGVSLQNANRASHLISSLHFQPLSVLHGLRFEKERKHVAHTIACLSRVQEPKIHVMYVTHEGDFGLFLASLMSLERLNASQVGRVYVLEDSGKPFSPVSKETLSQRCGIQLRFIRSRFPLAIRGPALVASEMLAFAQISATSGENEYIAKVDSDTLFVSDEGFSRVLASEADILGERVNIWEPFSYVQGGCYFLRCGMIPRMFSVPLRPVFRSVARATWKLTTSQVPEDGAIHELVNRCQGKAIFIDDLFVPWYGDHKSRSSKGSVAHLRMATKSEYEEFASWFEKVVNK